MEIADYSVNECTVAIKRSPLIVIGVVDSDPAKHGKLFNSYRVSLPAGNYA
jgi:hypothetical protein